MSSPSSSQPQPPPRHPVSGTDAGRGGVFRPEIQGLRAIAVLLVLIFHLWPKDVTGGFIGVDVFFVISGLLITEQLVREVERRGRIGLTHFWARRIRRLLPAALLVLGLSAVGVLVWMDRAGAERQLQEVATSALYVQNWAMAAKADADAAAGGWVLTVAQHFWSLSIEEQFYVLWPLLLIALLALAARGAGAGDDPSVARRRRRIMLAGLAAVAVLSLAWSVLSTPHDQRLAYLSTFARGWEFAAGGLLALALPSLRLGPVTRDVLGWIGLAMILGSAAWLTEGGYPGWIALVPVLGAVAVLLAGGGHGPRSTGWWLSRRPAVVLGDCSYSIYLIHWPLIVLVPNALADVPRGDKVMIGLATIALAWLSTRLVEDPLRRGPLLASRRRAYALALVAALTALALYALAGPIARV